MIERLVLALPIVLWAGCYLAVVSGLWDRIRRRRAARMPASWAKTSERLGRTETPDWRPSGGPGMWKA